MCSPEFFSNSVFAVSKIQNAFFLNRKTPGNQEWVRICWEIPAEVLQKQKSVRTANFGHFKAQDLGLCSHIAQGILKLTWCAKFQVHFPKSPRNHLFLKISILEFQLQNLLFSGCFPRVLFTVLIMRLLSFARNRDDNRHHEKEFSRRHD